MTSDRTRLQFASDDGILSKSCSIRASGSGPITISVVSFCLFLCTLCTSPLYAINSWCETNYELKVIAGDIVSNEPDLTLVTKDFKSTVSPLGLLFISESSTVRVEVEDKERRSVSVTERIVTEGPRQFVIHAVGEVWIRIDLLDFTVQPPR